MAPLWAERVRSQLRGPAEHTAEDATPSELRRSAFILVLMLIALVVLVAINMLSVKLPPRILETGCTMSY